MSNEYQSKIKKCSHISKLAEDRVNKRIAEVLAAFDDPSIPKHEIKRMFKTSTGVLARVIGRRRGLNAWHDRPYCAPPQCRPK